VDVVDERGLEVSFGDLAGEPEEVESAGGRW